MVELIDVSVSLAGKKVLDHISVRMERGEHWVITGRAASGKTSLAKVITGEIFYSGTVLFGPGHDAEIPMDRIAPRVSFVPQEHQFRNLNNTSDLYYQQRFNASESGQSLKVSDLLEPDNHWIDLLHLRELYDLPILQLSNGENKRLQLAQKLQDRPDILIFDNPFLGLDVSGRTILANILTGLVNHGVQIILITASSHLPAIVTHVLSLNNGKIDFSGTRVQFEDHHASRVQDVQDINKDLLCLLKPAPGLPFDFAVRMNNVNIRYGDKIVLENVDWELKRGECWSLSGPNGAGKSTLLSLITGDNPQAYANDIFLFDRKRGTGESIWDIKRNIGFVSPELHLFFNQGASCWEILASGFFDTIGLFRVLNDNQQSLVKTWLKILRLSDCEHKSLRSMSRGQQRLALLGRALIKNPPLLVLDEPCQGLDEEQTAAFIALVNQICIESGTTLIYVSHYLQDVPSVVTKYLRLEEGRAIDIPPQVANTRK